MHGRPAAPVGDLRYPGQFNKLDARVSQSMSDGGVPPPGLMSHVVYPEGDGFVVAEVWSTESQGQPYLDDVLPPCWLSRT